MLVIVTSLGMIKLPNFARNYIDTAAIKESVDSMYLQYPIYARMLMHDLTKIIKDCYVIAGSIKHIEDIHPMIEKLESIEDIELTTDQKNRIIKQAEDVVENNMKSNVEPTSDLDYNDEQEAELYLTDFFLRNSVMGI